MNWVDLGDPPLVAEELPTTFWARCECGALKTFGAGPLVPGHSHWCAWSTYRLKPGVMDGIPWFCELNGCMNPSGVCALANGKPDSAPVLGRVGTVHWYCLKCWGKVILAEHFSRWWFVQRPA